MRRGGWSLAILGGVVVILDQMQPFLSAWALLAGMFAMAIGTAIGSGSRAPIEHGDSLPQARAFELEEIDRELDSGLRALRVEFYARPLTAGSIAELEREVELLYRRTDADFERTLTGERESARANALLVEGPHLPSWGCDCGQCRRLQDGVRDQIVNGGLPAPLSPEERPTSPWAKQWDCASHGHLHTDSERCIVCGAEWEE